ncbi:MAG: M23 family metallopeptidase [Actinobacteria bacterium]|nr:M23 family metallopeptidase [Actinomycetota bacterium]
MSAAARKMRALLLGWILLVAALVGAAAPAWGRPTGTGGPGNRTYAPPVDAPVTDPFRPPPEPWMAGNRGIEYATVPGSAVRAIGPGAVVFAGPVAGALYVTILHPDGLRSSYSYLAAIRVRVGQRVRGGAMVGVAGERFHVGVRRRRVYLDPASLWGRPVLGGRVLLVPLDGGPRLGPAWGRR